MCLICDRILKRKMLIKLLIHNKIIQNKNRADCNFKSALFV